MISGSVQRRIWDGSGDVAQQTAAENYDALGSSASHSTAAVAPASLQDVDDPNKELEVVGEVSSTTRSTDSGGSGTSDSTRRVARHLTQGTTACECFDQEARHLTPGATCK